MNIIQTKVFQSSSLILTHPTFSLGRKRRASYEDEEMMNSEPLIEDNVLHITKRNRITSKKDLPIGKLLATLDKEKLIELINDLVDSNPHLKAEFEAQIEQQ
ncbi:hypothetical protein RO3G_04328 [Rhizopus delemar RA 99-880]|uniref:Tethering factor for nuclear proteasome STS1 n=1 Tax=Rhizopus delemar (strain RA 99-880 / ATCC MYA-4621 / FGSC 9543 / NRRL 43880) TaxID=246409 RepID=I1BTU3_RHIO9|nr:hypothetical protein RO3G_04328 [Rhizopus delemar RA 99-880]|eukprot:EIE79623.1 hypothetical protein RO3G_04328 [Rhizopus delemar RA 99-880]